ncbi:uncharacterized protein LOC104334722 isoform X4 [Opisthocomus hoazin]|uniref:uncharacterized protein LOC104334722 isoform X4 n=1 Tax=Opisthocomus hoazin TaxID=30419 RepID=UPI003F5360A1
MHRRGGPRCPPALWVLLCPVLVSVAGGQGPPECREEAVSANGALRLLPEKPPQTWAKVEWRKRLNAASYLRILTAEKNEAPRSSQGLFSGRAVFQQETLSLQISPVRVADSGVYRADFEDASGAVTSLHFCVSVWGLFGFFPWWAVAVSLGLALAISVALVVTCCWWRKRGKDPQRGDANETLTVYAEVGKSCTGQDPNGTSEATGTGNTIYTTICTTTQGPSCPQEPGTCTIYSVIQPTRKPSSLKRKRLDPALVSTAYVEATGGFRRSCHALQTLPPAPASRHLS